MSTKIPKWLSREINENAWTAVGRVIEHADDEIDDIAEVYADKDAGRTDDEACEIAYFLGAAPKMYAALSLIAKSLTAHGKNNEVANHAIEIANLAMTRSIYHYAKDLVPHKLPKQQIIRKPTTPTVTVTPFDRLPDTAILRVNELLRSAKNPSAPLPCSRATLYRWVREGHFPRPTKIGARVGGWQAGVVRNWLAQQEQSNRVDLAF